MSLSIEEFCALVDIAVKRYGKDVMLSEGDMDNQMHLTLGDRHLGYIDINTGSLVWDKEAA